MVNEPIGDAQSVLESGRKGMREERHGRDGNPVKVLGAREKKVKRQESSREVREER